MARLTSIDAYRGFVMLLIMGELLEFCRVARALPAIVFGSSCVTIRAMSPGLAVHCTISLQPSFSFLVGVAVPFSLASRKARAIRSGA